MANRCYKPWSELEVAIAHRVLDEGKLPREVYFLFPDRNKQDVRNILNTIRKRREGLCNCGKNPLPETGTKCADCVVRTKARTDRLKVSGICVKCADRRADATLTLCGPCHLRKIASSQPTSPSPPAAGGAHRHPGPGLVRWLACNTPAGLTQRLPLDRPPGVFVDLFGGSGAFSLALEKAGWEVIYNDLHPELVSYMRLMATSAQDLLQVVDELSQELDAAQLRWMYENPPNDRPLLRASVFFLMAYNVERRDMQKRSLDQVLAPSVSTKRQLCRKAARFARVTLHNEDYTEMIARYDGPNTFFFADPPWLGSEDHYEHPFKGRHLELSSLLLNCQGQYAWTMASNRKSLHSMSQHPHLNWWISRMGGSTFRQVLATNFEPLLTDPIEPARFGL